MKNLEEAMIFATHHDDLLVVSVDGVAVDHAHDGHT